MSDYYVKGSKSTGTDRKKHRKKDCVQLQKTDRPIRKLKEHEEQRFEDCKECCQEEEYRTGNDPRKYTRLLTDD